MPAGNKLGKRDRPGRTWLRKTLEGLRSQLTWTDLLVGVLGTLVLSGLMVGFHYHAVPDYRVGDIAVQDIRAPQDMAYEDADSTAAERRIAREQTAALYDYDSAMMSRIEGNLREAFVNARGILADRDVGPRGVLDPAVRTALLEQMEPALQGAIPPNVLPMFLQQRFNEVLEGRVIRVVQTVIRGLILDDQRWPRFLEDQRTGIVTRDTATRAERPLAGASPARSRTAASEYLRQFQLEFSDLSAQDRAQMLGFLDHLVTANLFYNEAETYARRAAAAARVAPIENHIKAGKTIVRNGEEVTPLVMVQLGVLRNLLKSGSLAGQLAGYFLFVAAFLYCLWRYLVHYRHRPRNIRRQTLLILIVLVEVFLVVRLLTGLADLLGERISAVAFHGPFYLYYLIPFAFAGMLVALLADVHLGIITSMVVASLSGLFFGDIYIATFAMLGSLGGVYSVHQYRDRAAILTAGLTVGLVNAVTILAIDFLRQAPLNLSSISLRALYGLMGGALASALASLLLPTLESLFKITTDIRLLELSNLNTPALRKLAVEAPGTYHHSLMVGTLGEAAAEAIGANPLLVRVGAYYHDLGKMFKPEYFVENQVFGMNKHESLSPSMSCLIIASHVKDGIEIARDIRLAPDIRDLIPQHHGTRIMTYFYRKALDAMNGKSHEIREADFRYPGPRPQTKEAAILMMADSVEAASRTLTDPSPAQIRGMIERLADSILADNQFDECDITMREIDLIKESIFKILTGLYHRRLDYPGYDFKSVQEKADRLPVTNSSSKHAKAV